MFINLLCWMTLSTLDYWHHSVKCNVGWCGQVKCWIWDRYIRFTPSAHSAIQQRPWSWSSELKTYHMVHDLSVGPGLAWFQPPQVKWVSAYNIGPVCSETGSLECLTIIFDWLMYLLQRPTNLYTTKRWSISWGTVSAFERRKFQRLPVHGPHLVPGSMLQHFKPLDSVPNPLHPFDEGEEEMLDELGGLLPGTGISWQPVWKDFFGMWS